ncbi:hypothetical protein [Terribacillus saccharophilus]|uniref:hypothetical protein n=1 Tax=Terribacillus saccharophilus TaxID=361277 RepID=UPI003D298D67
MKKKNIQLILLGLTSGILLMLLFTTYLDTSAAEKAHDKMQTAVLLRGVSENYANYVTTLEDLESELITPEYAQVQLERSLNKTTKLKKDIEAREASIFNSITPLLEQMEKGTAVITTGENLGTFKKEFISSIKPLKEDVTLYLTN